MFCLNLLKVNNFSVNLRPSREIICPWTMKSESVTYMPELHLQVVRKFVLEIMQPALTWTLSWLVTLSVSCKRSHFAGCGLLEQNSPRKQILKMDCSITPYITVLLFHLMHLVCLTCLLDNLAKYLHRSERVSRFLDADTPDCNFFINTKAPLPFPSNPNAIPFLDFLILLQSRFICCAT